MDDAGFRQEENLPSRFVQTILQVGFITINKITFIQQTNLSNAARAPVNMPNSSSQSL
ncbi:MAG: hypothetical protein HC806_01830 [Anaerolineae bacterium]|nr:hypothetical protein [Anaerolineae bacterium]